MWSVMWSVKQRGGRLRTPQHQEPLSAGTRPGQTPKPPRGGSWTQGDPGAGTEPAEKGETALRGQTAAVKISESAHRTRDVVELQPVCKRLPPSHFCSGNPLLTCTLPLHRCVRVYLPEPLLGQTGVFPQLPGEFPSEIYRYEWGKVEQKDLIVKNVVNLLQGCGRPWF